MLKDLEGSVCNSFFGKFFSKKTSGKHIVCSSISVVIKYKLGDFLVFHCLSYTLFLERNEIERLAK